MVTFRWESYPIVNEEVSYRRSNDRNVGGSFTERFQADRTDTGRPSLDCNDSKPRLEEFSLIRKREPRPSDDRMEH